MGVVSINYCLGNYFVVKEVIDQMLILFFSYLNYNIWNGFYYKVVGEIEVVKVVFECCIELNYKFNIVYYYLVMIYVIEQNMGKVFSFFE